MRKKAFVIAIISILAIVGIITYKKNTTSKHKIHEVKTTKLIESVYASGYIDSSKGVVVKSEVSGIVERLFVREGDDVRVGQILATIKNDSLKENLSEVRTQIDLVRQRLKEDSDFLSDIRNMIAIKKAIYDNALKNFERKKALYEEELISKERFDDAVRELEVASKDLNRHQNILNDSLKSLESQYKGLVYKEKAIIAEIEKHTIKSPINGRITRRFVKEGDYVNTLNQTNEIFSIGNTNDIETVLMIDEENVPYIKNGMKVLVTSDPFVNEIFEGVIRIVESQSDRASRLVKARAMVDYKDKPVVINMSVEANIIIRQGTGLFIPVEAYSEGYVEVLEGNDKKRLKVDIDPRPIKGYYQVLSGLSEGQRVITK
ncbi:MAG: efflux RND transporter periplasmic adaptor subunit [Thermodesulfovibrionales bacterium]|nr:efflux RND transporter periplasmic adaptor subunit [Thermodesulfovibrionales bacterium]